MITSSVLDYVPLLKLRIVALLLFVSLAAAYVATRGNLAIPTTALLLLTGTLSAGGAGVLNHYFERDLDRLMPRTSHRPLASGRIVKPRVALVLGLCLITLSALVALPSNAWLAIFNSTGAFVYVVIYTLWLKRRSPWNIVIGGAAGSCAILSGWAAVGPWWTPQAFLMALLVFLWTPPHFWSLAIVRLDDYKRAGVPMLPVVAGPRVAAVWGLVLVLLLAAVGAALAWGGVLGPLYLWTSSAAAAILVATAIYLALRPCKDTARLHFRASIIYLAAVFAAMAADTFLIHS